MTLVDALPAAQAKQSLILLDLHSAALSDKKGDQWIASAEANPAAARVMNEMVLAFAGVRSPAMKSLPDLAVFNGNERHLIVLDAWGGMVLDLNEAFGDVAKFAMALNALQQQAPAFIRAGVLRREGKFAGSLLTWAGGLLDAGAAEEARAAFVLTESVAQRDSDAAMIQNAQLGIAALDMQDVKLHVHAMNVLQEIVAHPVTTEIASRAWLLLAFTFALGVGASMTIAA